MLRALFDLAIGLTLGLIAVSFVLGHDAQHADQPPGVAMPLVWIAVLAFVILELLHRIAVPAVEWFLCVLVDMFGSDDS